MENVINKESATTSPASLVVPKSLTTTELHENLEKYIAKQRLEGLKKTKPEAIVDILNKFFESNG